MLEVRGLECSYGVSQVLFGIDLEIGQGEVVSLLGRNGMGKSTTVRAIMGLVPPKSGEVTFEGGMKMLRLILRQEFASSGTFRVGSAPTLRPLTSTVPELANSWRRIRRSIVDLPAPDGPVMKTNSPRPISRLTSCSAVILPG